MTTTAQRQERQAQYELSAAVSRTSAAMMSDEELKAAVADAMAHRLFDLSKVTSVYSGRKGCACGCRGKYAYASAHADTRPDYKTGDEDVSDRSVKQVVKKVEALLRSGDVERVMLAKDGYWLAVDLPHDRTYTLYFAA